MPIWPIYQEIGQNGLNWQCFFAGSSKTSPIILIFSIAMGANYSFYVKFIATYAPTFLRYNNSVLAIVVAKVLLSNLYIVPDDVILGKSRIF